MDFTEGKFCSFPIIFSVLLGGITVELLYKFTKKNEYFLQLQTSVFLTVECNVTLTVGTKEYLTLYTKYIIDRCRYNRVQLFCF